MYESARGLARMKMTGNAYASLEMGMNVQTLGSRQVEFGTRVIREVKLAVA